MQCVAKSCRRAVRDLHNHDRVVEIRVGPLVKTTGYGIWYHLECFDREVAGVRLADAGVSLGENHGQ